MAVKYLFSKKEPNTRLQRWCLALQEFKFTIKHIEGKKNAFADFLSRYPAGNGAFACLEDGDNELMLEHLYNMVVVPDVDYEESLLSVYR